MKKNTLLTLLFILIVLTVCAQQVQRIPAVNENWELLSDACKAIEPARQKVEKRTDQYEQDLDEYKKGLFCYDCRRSARQIETELHITLEEHLKTTPNKKTISATSEMYAELYKKYKADWDALYKQYQSQIKNCTEANVKAVQQHTEERQLLINTFNTDYTNIQDKITTLDKTNPTQASKLKNQAIAIRNEFQTETNKKSKANAQKMRDLTTQLRKIDDGINMVDSNTASSNLNNSSKQQPVKIQQPATNNNQITQAQRIQGLQQTQNYINQQNQQREQSTQTITNGIQQIGNTLLEAQNEKFERQMAAIDNFSAKEREMISVISKHKSESITAFFNKDYNTAIDKYYTIAYLDAEDAFNQVSFMNIGLSKRFHKAIGADYFPKSKADAYSWQTLNLLQKLPDLYYLPTCHCYTENTFQRKYDSAFILLRSVGKCKSIVHQGKSFSIKYDKKTIDRFDEKQAIIALHQAISNKQLTSIYDWIDYTNSFVWLGYLENKNAKTMEDLYNGLETMVYFFRNIQASNPYVSNLEYSIGHYLTASYQIIAYYLTCYYYRINSELKDSQITAKVADNLYNISTTSFSLFTGEYAKQYTKQMEDKFTDQKFLLK